MRTLTKGLVLAITCIMLMSSMPAMADSTQSLGGTSASTSNGGGAVTGQEAQITDTDTITGERDLTASIMAEVEVPVGSTGDASFDWDVPEDSGSNSKSVSGTGALTGSKYTLEVGAYGIASAAVEKTSKTGYAYSRAEIYSNAHAMYDIDAILGFPGVYGSSSIASQALLTGTGSATATAEGSAYYEATLSVPDGEMAPIVLAASGSAEGAATLDAENVVGGTIGGSDDFVPDNAIAGLSAFSSAATEDDAFTFDYFNNNFGITPAVYAGSANIVDLTGARATTSSGTTAAMGSAAGSTTAKSSTTADENNYDVATSSAVVGADGLTFDMTGSVSAPAKADKTESQAIFATESGYVAEYDYLAAYSELGTHSMANRAATCCVNGEIALATSEITEAVWDASASHEATLNIEEQEPASLWQVCLTGATGLTRDGSSVATEPGFAVGATSMNRKGALTSDIYSFQAATVNSNGFLDAWSDVDQYLKGPKYTPTSSIEDAVGGRFAIDYETMISSNGLSGVDSDYDADEDTIGTSINGPDAYLWITGDNAQLVNGHFADDGISIYEVTFDPKGSYYSDVYGPELSASAATRTIYLEYGTDNEEDNF